ncbi:hypothetical protein PQS31_03670 [Luteimonas sp BLCC-B24]|uniref:hypothetical protein n=1 Tax=Luteimonas sp. BLCC-B24 TaxID=3025317 RepID=UPI00234C0CFC|nr:hypothetical protein [Luteimonas sp. BLCC-B24]MDC7805920.1 hypothetical protein [Luteimonas sp. BLCC-B24]
MNTRTRSIAMAAAAIGVGLAIVLAVRWLGTGPGVPAAGGGEAPGPVAEQAAAVDAGSERETAPWERDLSSTAAGALATRSAAEPDAPAMTEAEAGRAVAELRVQSRNNIEGIDRLLGELDALERTGQAPADVSLGALRDNLRIARRAQELAQELAESTQQPASPRTEQRQAEIVAELQQLQGQVRYDVSGPAGPAARAVGAQ